MLGFFTLGEGNWVRETINCTEIFHYFSHVKRKVLKQLGSTSKQIKRNRGTSFSYNS